MVGRIRRDDGSGDNPAREGEASADPTWHGEARGRRIRPPLHAPRTRIRLRWCVSGVDAGGSTADPVTGRLRDCGRQPRRRRIGPPFRAPRTRRRPPRRRVRTPKDMEEQRRTPP
ncbi:Os07g0547000 [Oryza sativa Japonica Group]|uniref:Os07g0547000 protein n=1 Tax=Oryza sativa subsp. japonica TaxID=39947 RepID=A0A0N7KNM3_ORYSJ|nr:Os07g0547000 [Oryza sativa Japonica Group]